MGQDEIFINNLFIRIKNLMPSFNKAQKKVAEYFISNKDDLKFLKIRQLALNCDVSEATITRFIRKIGFSSFQNFKYALVKVDSSSRKRVGAVGELDTVNTGDPINDLISKVKNEYLTNIQLTLSNLDTREILNAIEAIKIARSISFFCVGTSFVAAKNSYLRFYRAGIKTAVYNDPAEMGIAASLTEPGDVAVALSYSGKTEVVNTAMKIAKENGAKTIAITGPGNSPLIKMADVKITSQYEELDDYLLTSFARLSQVIIMDIIYTGVAEKDFEKSVQSIQKISSNAIDILHH